MSTRDASKLRRTIDIRHFAIDLTSSYALDLVPHKVYHAKEVPLTAGDLMTLEIVNGKQMHVDAKALVAGIDLSDLGYGPGESASRLMFQDTPEDKFSVDPVLIVGLPDLEPPGKRQDQ